METQDILKILDRDFGTKETTNLGNLEFTELRHFKTPAFIIPNHIHHARMPNLQ